MVDDLRAITVLVLVLDGGASASTMRSGADVIAVRLANGQRRTLDGQTHEADPVTVSAALIGHSAAWPAASRRPRGAPMTDPVRGSAYFPSIEKKYGKPISYWQQLLHEYRTQHPDAKHMQQVAWLKSEHGLGHGHANAIVAATPTG